MEQFLPLAFREHVDTLDLECRNANRLAFRDVDGDVDLILLVVELDVKRGDTRVGKTAIAIERLQALQIGFEGAAIEEPLSPPGKA